MENAKRKNIIVRIGSLIKKGWERLGEADVEDGIDLEGLGGELARIEGVQKEIHESGVVPNSGFVPTAKVNATIAQKNVENTRRIPKSREEK